MQRYEKYKDSGIEWIGEIPEHWEVKKIKFISTIQGRIGFKGYSVHDIVASGEGALTLGAKHISKNNKIDLTEPEFISWDKYYESPEIMLKTGDILVAQRGSLGKVALLDSIIGEATINPSLLILRNLAILPEFLLYYLSSNVFLEFIKIINSATAVPMISQQQLGDFKLPICNDQEQITIASFLDRKTTEIDHIIANKQKLIALYEEEKQAIINQAVTKGLDPNVKMKDSGVEWLGEIPEHWGNVSLKWISKIYSGGTPSKNIQDYWQNGTIPWLNSGTVNQFFITEPSDYITEDALQNSSAKWIPEGSIVIALAGQGKTKGMAAQVKFECTCNQSMGIIVPNKLINNRFLLYYLTRNYQNIRNLGGGDNRDGINLEMVGGIVIPLMPKNEQTEIVEFIEKENNRLDTIISKFNKQIDLLQEYRTTLISEVVTGKIKVCE